MAGNLSMILFFEFGLFSISIYLDKDMEHRTTL